MKLRSNIIVVDDDIETLELLSATLRKAGNRVYPAASYDGLLEQINVIHQENHEIDVILLDLMMPGRSGYEILDSIKFLVHPFPPVIILSALSGVNDAVKALEKGAKKYLTKPTTPEKLLKAVREVVDS